MIRLYLLSVLAICIGCNNTSEDDLVGLWQLEKVNFMHFEKKFEQAILSINENGTFAVSETEKDFVGVYKVSQDTLKFFSREASWFNEKWKVKVNDGKMLLTGVSDNRNYTSLVFKSLERIPNLNAVEEKLIGSWVLYKVRGNGRSDKNLSNTLLYISEDGQYMIHDDLGLLEQGKMYINSRHNNIVFESNDVIWDVLLLDGELRLTNEQTGLQYCLRENESD